MRHRNRDYPLIIGGTLLLLVLLIGIFGPTLAPHDPMEVVPVRSINGTIYGPPPRRALGPFIDWNYPLGMDRVNRDVLSRLLWAARPTLILCAVVAAVRLSLGLLIGGLAGWFSRQIGWFLNSISLLGGMVPLLLIAIAVLGPVGESGIRGYIIALSVAGWIGTALIVQARIQTILHAPYLESARAIGVRPWGIFWRHVLPQVWPVLPMLLAAELTATTLLVAELGYLGYFIGGGFVYTDNVSDAPTPDVVIRSAGFPELGQMLSDFFGQINRTPWVSLFAGIVVVLMLSAFTLLSESLRRRLDVTRPRPVRSLLRRQREPQPRKVKA